jgi:hypothetical protein
VKTLNRLQLKMTELHPDIKYIEGKNNIVANFLSRYHRMNIHVTDVKYDKGWSTRLWPLYPTRT